MFPLCGFSLSLFCNYSDRVGAAAVVQKQESLRPSQFAVILLYKLVRSAIPTGCTSDTYTLVVPPEWAGHLAGAGFALRCWLCSASADVVMRRVYGALLVAATRLYTSSRVAATATRAALPRSQIHSWISYANYIRTATVARYINVVTCLLVSVSTLLYHPFTIL